MIDDIRKLKSGTLLKSIRSQLFVTRESVIPKCKIDENQIVMFIEFKLLNSFGTARPIMYYPTTHEPPQDLCLKLLVNERFCWVVIATRLRKSLPKDILDTYFVCPYFNIVNEKGESQIDF